MHFRNLFDMFELLIVLQIKILNLEFKFQISHVKYRNFIFKVLNLEIVKYKFFIFNYCLSKKMKIKF